MKGMGTGRIIKAITATLALGLGMTACSRDYTVGYLYVPSAGNATISAYSIDFQSGALQQLADSPIQIDGTTTTSQPVAIVASPDSKNVYVVLQKTSAIVQFAVGTDGKLYGKKTTNVVTANGITGSSPTFAAVDPSGKFLYVTFTYQNGFTPALPGPGGLATFPLAADGTVGSPLINTTIGTTSAQPLPYIPLGNSPVGVSVSPKGGFVYVVDQEKTTAGTPFGVLLAFTQNTTTGTLAPIVGPLPGGGFPAGTTPSAVATEPRGVYTYVTDQATNQIYGFQVTNGAILALRNSPFTTGLFPLGISIDPRGSFLYVANFGSSSVSIFNVNANGDLTGSGTTQVATGPTCVTIEPALGIYLYTSNKIDNSVSGEQLDPHNGSLRQVQGSQFSSQPLPICAATVANGAHATQLVN